MSFETGFRYGFLHGRGHEQGEQERISRLLSYRPPPDPPELIKPTRCRVLRGFFVAGELVEPGMTTTLPWYDANSLAALGKVEIIK
jgi:hypothetical protein